jgi:CheY-like chemotaxis protein
MTTMAKPARILVVDDEPEICAVFREALQREGFSVTACTTGEQAVQESSREPFDLVFLDIMMPRMNGRQVLQLLRRRLPKAIFVMITGFPDSDLVEGCLEDGAFLCLFKPVSLADILELVRDATSQEPSPAHSGSPPHL